MRKAAVIILGLEVLVLALAVVVFLAGENDGAEQPASVPLSSSLTKPLKTSVPVAVNLATVGTVTTAAFRTRGGQAVSTTSANADAGMAAGRPTVSVGGETGVVDAGSQHAPRP